MSGVRLPPVTTLQLTTFGPWNRVVYILQPWGWSWMTRTNPPCAPPDVVIISSKHTTAYTNILHKQYWLAILVSTRIIGQSRQSIPSGLPVQAQSPSRCGC